MKIILQLVILVQIALACYSAQQIAGFYGIIFTANAMLAIWNMFALYHSNQ